MILYAIYLKLSIKISEKIVKGVWEIIIYAKEVIKMITPFLEYLYFINCTILIINFWLNLYHLK